VSSVAVFLTILGVAHITNLVVLPIVGLVFSAVTRRTSRRAAGDDAGPVSPQARHADRLATALVMVGVLLMVVAVLAAVFATASFGFNR
jgi:hypothetical protein